MAEKRDECWIGKREKEASVPKVHEEEIFPLWHHARNIERIKGLYGMVVDDQDKDIISLIDGKRILDVGAGYGLLVKKLRGLGYDPTGIEPDEGLIYYAKKYFSTELLNRSIYKTDFPEGYFDTVIIRETLPHLDFDKALSEIGRICGKTVVIFDSAVQPLLKLARSIMGHHEYNQKELNDYMGILKNNGYEIIDIRFRDIFVFPLSGGYISPFALPASGWFGKVMITADGITNFIINRIGLQKILCWRYLIKARKK